MSSRFKFRVWDNARKRYLESSETSLHAFTNYFLNFDGTIGAITGAIGDHEKVQYQNLDWVNYAPGDIKVTKAKDRFALEQFTGLTNNCGVEIYENDIVETYLQTSVCKNGDSIFETKTAQIIFHKGQFVAHRICWGVNRYQGPTEAYQWNVVGNIHQNFELFTNKP